MIGVFGGTFDPVHHGHLRIALELYQQLGLDELRFVPCRQPPHRAMPQASVEQRLEMLRLAIAGQSAFVIDERELLRDGPSYMVDTLSSIRAEMPDQAICLILGADAFGKLSSWHRWESLIELAHIVVAMRPGSPLMFDDAMLHRLRHCQVTDSALLKRALSGYVIQFQVPQLDISSMYIRGQLSAGLSARYLLPDTVWDYMQQQHIYSSSIEDCCDY